MELSSKQGVWVKRYIACDTRLGICCIHNSVKAKESKCSRSCKAFYCLTVALLNTWWAQKSCLGFFLLFFLVCLVFWFVGWLGVWGWFFLQHKKFEAQAGRSAIAGVSHDCINPFNSLRGKKQLFQWSRARWKEKKQGIKPLVSVGLR